MQHWKRYTLYLGIGLLVVLAPIAVVTYLISGDNIKPDTQDKNQAEGASITSEPINQNGLNVQVSLPKATYTYGDTLEFTWRVENISNESKRYQFGCTYTGGELLIDDMPANQVVCGQAITELTLEPGQVETYTHQLQLVKELPERYDELDTESPIFDRFARLSPGTYEVRVEWRQVVSGTIEFEIR